MLFPPTNLALVSKTLSSVTMNWIAAPQATTYNLYRDNKLIASGILVLTYTDTTVNSNRRYSYRVSGMVAGIETPYSDQFITNIHQGNNLTFESVYQLQPGEGGYPDILWRWQ